MHCRIGSLEKISSKHSLLHDVHCLYGSAPCQPFSAAGKRVSKLPIRQCTTWTQDGYPHFSF
ncbi:DNA cytosine methyltransferase [Dickeya chrysanthemi]|uniref:DNA cytosine methyltransferase n=1 Tax=Dickeya chrysanthemi TaxID=556 RepID=UPI003AFB3990